VYGKWNSSDQKSYWSAALGNGAVFMEIRGAEVNPATMAYVALTYDAASTKATLYVATTQVSWDAVTPMVVPAYTPALSNNLYIAANSNTVPAQPLPPPPPQPAPPVDVPFIGRMQEVAFYNAALSEATLAKRRVF
jgi:hypothetical protein